MAINREIARTPAKARRDARRKEKRLVFARKLEAEFEAEHLAALRCREKGASAVHAKIQP